MQISSPKKNQLVFIFVFYTALSLVAIIINYYFKGIVNYYFNISFFYLLFFTTIFFVIYLIKKEYIIKLFKKISVCGRCLTIFETTLNRYIYLIKFLFIIILFVTISAYLLNIFTTTGNENNLINNLYISHRKILAFITIALGSILLFLKHKKITNTLISEECLMESGGDTAKIWGSIILFSIIFLFLFIAFASGRVTMPIGGDEQHLFNTALGYLKSGKFYQWNWFNNTGFRDYFSFKEYSLLLATLFKLFGTSSYIARLPGLITAILAIILSYVLVKNIFKNRTIALAFVAWLATNPFFIFYATVVRHYIFFILAVLIFYYAFYKSFDLVLKKLKYNYVIVSVLTLIAIAFVVDKVNFTLVYPAILAITGFFIYRWYCNKWSLLSVFSLLIVSYSLVAIFSFLPYVQIHYNAFFKPISFSERYSEISFLNLPYNIGIIFILFIFIFALRARGEAKAKFYNAYFYFFTFFASSQWIIIYILDRGLGWHYRYVSHLIIINFLLLIAGLYLVIKAIGIEKEKMTIAILLPIIFLMNFSLLYPTEIHYKTYKRPNEFYYKRMLNTYTDENLQIFPPDHKKANQVLKMYIDKNTIWLDGGLTYSSFYYKDLNLLSANYYTFCHKGLNLQYICGEDRDANFEHIKSAINKYSNKTIIVTWLKRKEYNMPKDIIGGIKTLGFKHISGFEVDGSNVEVYFLRK